MIFGISGTKRTVRYREVSVLQRCRKERLDCILIFSFQFTGSNGVLDTFLVFLVLFNYVIPISLYVTVGRYPERYGTVSLCKKRLLLNIAPRHRDVLRHQQQGLMRGACNLMKFNNRKKFCYQNASGKDLEKKPDTSSVLLCLLYFDILLKKCTCNLTYVSSTFETSSFFPNPLFIVCSVLQDGTENASRKVARKNRMRAGERRVLKMEPLRIDCLPFTWANLWVHGLGKW